MEKSEEDPVVSVPDAEITGIKFSLASLKEISTSSISDSAISHASQLTNPFLGLPLEFGKCESCGTSEPGKCDGHFGYIELPAPIYNPSHVSELKKMLSLLCLKCLKIRKTRSPGKGSGIAERLLAACCQDSPQVSIKEGKNAEGALYLQLKAPSKCRIQDGFWKFLDRYGFRYGYGVTRSLLASEVVEILKKIPQDTKRKLSAKGYFPQEGYVLLYLPVPPNCLSVPDVSDGLRVMSTDPSMAMLKKILRQCEVIRSSRSGISNFESHEVESNELQTVVHQYFEARGTSQVSNDVGKRFGISKDPGETSTKAWLRKMKTLFISKGSGYSSRCVITGDSYKRVNEIGIPFEVAQGITFEERVNMHNIKYLQELVDNKQCLTYKDGSTTYSLREGSKGHTFLRHGQIVHRRIMDGDIVFVNRPPTTHKHSLQALSVYVHEDSTIKINPLICGPLGADFDGDSIHIFYPQSPAARAEVLELFSVEKQLLSSHNGNLNLQLATDSMLSLKLMFMSFFFDKAAAQQLSMFVCSPLPPPAVLKAKKSTKPYWTTLQMLQTALPAHFDCDGEKYLISDSDLLKVDFTKEVLQSVISEIVHSIFFEKGPAATLKFFDSLQPMLMEHLYAEGFSVSLEDFYITRGVVDYIHQDLKVISPLLGSLRTTYNERAEMQLESHIYHAKLPVSNFIVNSSLLGVLIDSKSDSAVDKVVQQIGFLGLQLSDRGKFYSKTLIEDIANHFDSKYYDKADYPSLRHGLVKNCFINGLDPVEGMVHSISAREAMVRSSRGLAEPGTLFKNLMAILRDVVICYDGTVRNLCSNSIIQFEYGTKAGIKSESLFPAGEPVGVLAATAISNPAYKAEILLCRVNFRNDLNDRRVILYLNDCDCGRKYCRENAAMSIKNHLKKASLRDATLEFMIEYKNQQPENLDFQSGLCGHLHLNKAMLQEWNINMQDVLLKCEEKLSTFRKSKKTGHIFKKIILYTSECCSFHHSGEDKSADPCLMFLWQDVNDGHLERTSDILADWICPVLLDTIIKGDPRIFSVNIMWVAPDASSWIKNNSNNRKGEIVVDIVIEKSFVKESGDAWRVAMNSCLPLLHLIDTTRSIPYAMKEGQELLGISVSFNQAVQRLSTSIRSVARGILKEHLVLLANSMTCAGNLVGFTSGGFKAFARLLNIQVPITEATHSTPKKCFERAAEKCHLDTLKSVVASCAFGKPVALGTGTRFDIFLDEKVGFKQDSKIDVYDFLHMVRGTKKDESDTGCLGVELDELDFDEDNMDWNLSPVHDGSAKPVFDDIIEVEDTPSGWQTENTGGWGSTPAKAQNESIGTAGWDALSSKKDNQSSDGWGTGWGSKPEKTIGEENGNVGANGAWESKSEQNTAKSDAWGSSQLGQDTKAQEENGQSSGWGVKPVSAKSDAWGSGKQDAEAEQNTAKSDAWGSSQLGQDTKAQEKNGQSSGWGAKPVSAKSDAWGSGKQDAAPAEEQEKSSGWGGGGWGQKSEQAAKTNAWNSTKQDPSSTEAQDTEKANDWGAAAAAGGWGANTEQTAKPSVWGAKNQEREKADDFGTGGGGWGSNSEQTAKPNVWGANKQAESEKADTGSTGTGGGWGSKPEPTGDSNVWGAKKQDSGFVEPERPQKAEAWGNSSGGGGWASKSEPTINSNAWAAKKQDSGFVKPQGPEKAGAWGNSGGSRDAGQATPKTEGWGTATASWQSSTNVESSGKEDPDGWGSKIVKSTVNSSAWGAAKQNADSDKEKSEEWGAATGGWNAGEQNAVKADGGGNWGSKSDNQGSAGGNWGKQNSAKTDDENKNPDGWGTPSDSWGGATGGWGSNSQEQTPRKKSWGDKNGAEDQTFVVDNILKYHPEKDMKMGAGIEHLTVNKHTIFQESRCMHVVSTDGLTQDFSYRKCLEYFIKGKYPDLAEEFVPKYFAKPQPRPPRNPVSQETTTEGQKEETETAAPASEQQKEDTETAPPAATEQQNEETETAPPQVTEQQHEGIEIAAPASEQQKEDMETAPPAATGGEHFSPYVNTESGFVDDGTCDTYLSLGILSAALHERKLTTFMPILMKSHWLWA
ncbi:hypothetical protein ACFE04_002316 [Oxalis oulophora]